MVKTIIELTIGEHDDKTHSLILEAMHNSARNGNTGYASVPGTKSLRQEVANPVQNRTGVYTTPNNVIITPGGQAGLFATHIALANRRCRASLLTHTPHIPQLFAVPD